MIQLLLSGIEPIYFVLAYSGMILHILLKVADLNQNPDSSFLYLQNP
jgi:hypothetical protein